jgi:hypothetical protein
MTNIHPQPAQEERRMRPRRGAVLPFTKSADDPTSFTLVGNYPDSPVPM